MTGANLRTYEMQPTLITLGATPILINLNSVSLPYVTGCMLMPSASMVITNGITGAVLAQGVPVTCSIELNGPARFYIAGAGTAGLLIYKTANDSIYG